MPKRSIPYHFLLGTNPYFPDWQDTPALGVTGKGVFNAPPDLSDGNINAIIAAAGATRGSLNDPCPETGYTALRRLRFVRASGNTMTIAVNSSSNLINSATTISSILSSASSVGSEVVCIQLLGEEWVNLNDEFGVVYSAGSTATTHKATNTAAKQWFHAGTVEYQADYTNPIGGTVFQSVKSISDNQNASATQLGSTWNSCVGSFVEQISCPRGRSRSNPLDHRRFILTFIVELDPSTPGAGIQSEQIELPITDQGGVAACGADVAGLTGLYCMGYRGESYSRFHKVL